MLEHECGWLPVVVVDRVVGVISDRDVCIAACTESRLLSDIPVWHAMITEVVACQMHDPIEHVEKLMAEHQVRRLPVLDSDDKLAGVVSIDDLARQSAQKRGERRAISPGGVGDTLASVVE